MDYYLNLMSLGIIVVVCAIIFAVAKFSKKNNFILGDGFQYYVKGYLIALCILGTIICGLLIVISFLSSFDNIIYSFGYDKITFLILYTIAFIINISGVFIGFGLLKKKKNAYKLHNIFLIINTCINLFAIIMSSSVETREIFFSIFYFCMLIYFWHRKHLFVK